MSRVAEGHPSPAPAEFLSPIIEDTPCPTCAYNLRGLHAPRCPECGLAFEWWDIYKFRRLPARRREDRIRAVGLVGGIIGLIVFAISGAAPVLVGLAVVVGVVCLIVFLHVLLEVACLSLIARIDVSRALRSWFFGALVGDLAVGFVLILFAASHATRSNASPDPFTGMLMVILFWAGAAAWATWSQYVVAQPDVCRLSGPVSNRRLLSGCIVLKSALCAILCSLTWPLALSAW